MIPRRLLPTALLVALLALGLCAALLGAAAPPSPEGFQLNGDAERGRAVYAKSCAVCHGAAGDGKSKMAGSLKPRPTDFTNKALIADSTSRFRACNAALSCCCWVGFTKRKPGFFCNAKNSSAPIRQLARRDM